MTSPATDGKQLVNALYHGAVVTGIAVGYARFGKIALGGYSPKLDFTPRDLALVAIDVALALATKDVLVKQGIIPADIMKKWRVLQCSSAMRSSTPLPLAGVITCLQL